MTRALGIAVLLTALVLAGACGREAPTQAAPREPDGNAVGFYCRMGLKEHKGPKGQILPKGMSDPLWFSSVRDALSYVEMEIVSDQEIAGFWVNDMGEGSWEAPAPGAWVEASTAHYVVGSRKMSGMGGAEAVPFKARSAAEAFASVHGGRVVDYGAARREVAEIGAGEAGEGGDT